MSSRPHGVVGSAAGLVPFGHLGWGYRDRRDFLRRAAEYLTDGLRQGQYAVYVGDGTTASLTAELARVRKFLAADITSSPVEVIPVGQFYAFVPGTDVVDPQTSVAERVAATELALSAGYSGFRAVVDVTGIVRSERQRAAFARFEFLVDECMSRLPVSALCAYDLCELGDGARQLVCLHPYVNADSAPYQVFAAPDADAAVSGAVDTHDAAGFVRALLTACGRGHRTAITVDARGLDYLAPAAVRRLDETAGAEQLDITLLVRSPRLVRSHERLCHVRLALRSPVAPDTGTLTAVQAELSQLRDRLAGQPVIEQCKGMLMAAFGLSDGDAFALLQSLSQNSNVKLRELARTLVDEWCVDGPRPDYDDATAFLLRSKAVRSGPG